MSAWADAKKAARQVVHDTFALPGIFYENSAGVPTVDDGLVTVRIHDKNKRVGDLAGTNLSYAEFVERPTQAILLTEEMADRNLRRGSMIVMLDYAGNVEGFHIDNVHPPDGLTITCDLTALSISELSGKLLPDGTTVP